MENFNYIFTSSNEIITFQLFKINIFQKEKKNQVCKFIDNNMKSKFLQMITEFIRGTNVPNYCTTKPCAMACAWRGR